MNSIIESISQQLALSTYITNTCENFIKMEDGEVREDVDRYISYLKKKWQRFRQNHDDILLALIELTNEERQLVQSHSYFTEQVFSKTKSCYLASTEQITATSPTETSERDRSSSSFRSLLHELPSTSHNQTTRLPRFNIPTFDGTPSEWLKYKDRFSSLVKSNSSLADDEKLQYLKTSLIGTAAKLHKHTTLSSENFTKAWDSLVAFYDNVRIQVNTALLAWINLKAMKEETADELERIYTTVLQLYHTLETLGRPIDTWDDFLVLLTIMKLDAETARAWENKLGSSRVPPTWTELYDFLTTRLYSLRAYEEAKYGKGVKPVKAKNSDNSAPAKTGCAICKGKHYVVKCPRYIDERTSTDERIALIVKYKLCYNCLGSHRVSHCKVAKRCKTCGRKHHTTIHKLAQKEVKLEPSDQTTSSVADQVKVNILRSTFCREEWSPPDRSYRTDPPMFHKLDASANQKKIKLEPPDETTSSVAD